MMKANDMRVFLLRWYDKFPEFKSMDLFLTGESYAGQHVVTFASVNIFLYLCYQVIDIVQLDSGHYIPQLANVLLNHNKYSTGFKFKIKGVAVRWLFLPKFPENIFLSS